MLQVYEAKMDRTGRRNREIQNYSWRYQSIIFSQKLIEHTETD